MPLNILVAEDNKELADSYRTILEARGHTVTITSNGMECTNIYRRYLEKQVDGTIKRYFDLVILDQKMLYKDGIQAAKEIQQANPAQKIIFVTGYGESVLQKLPQLLGKVVVMSKPFTAEAFVTQVEALGAGKLHEMPKTIRN
jgi:two-component system, cell cycle response regulator CpdR